MQLKSDQLASLVPLGLVAARPWLLGQGVDRHTLDNWVKSNQLVPVARGVFKRPDTELTWQGVACSLQHMGLALAPGGLTSLTLQGMAHYVSQNEQNKIHLYGSDPLPSWLNNLLPDVTFDHHKGLDLDTGYRDSDPGFHFVPWRMQFLQYGYEKQPLQISSPELAMLEVLLDVPLHVSLEHASELMQGLPTLSPQRISRLLERCDSVKVKRLFLWLAEHNQSPWLKKIDLEKFSIHGGTLGSGKRMIVKGGKLDAKYLITVPQEMLVNNYG
jgi:hypothetical protein